MYLLTSIPGAGEGVAPAGSDGQGVGFWGSLWEKTEEHLCEQQKTEVGDSKTADSSQDGLDGHMVTNDLPSQDKRVFSVSWWEALLTVVTQTQYDRGSEASLAFPTPEAERGVWRLPMDISASAWRGDTPCISSVEPR